MDDRAVRPGAGNRVEAEVPEVAAFLAEALQFRRGRHLVDAALRRLDLQPVQEARERRTVPCLCRAMAGLFDRILDRLGQDRGIAARDDMGAGLVQRLEDRRHGALRVDRDRLAGERPQSRLELAPFMHAHAIAQMLADVVADLLAVDEQVGGAVVADQREGEGDRGSLNVLAADVERPGDRIQCGEHGGVRFLLLQPVGHVLALGRRALARIDIGMDDQSRPARFGLVGPDLVDRVLPDRDELRPLVGERVLRLRHPLFGVQPGIIADPPAVRRVLLQPVCDAGLRHRLVGPEIAVHLIAHLQRIAPVDEDRRLLRQHHRRTRRALEAGQPGEALRIAADIFAHMLIGQRHDEAVEPVGLQLLAERGEAGFIRRHWTLSGSG